MVRTGDTLFVGDVGRPDFGGEEAAGALYPAHISGSPCGRAMSGKPSSTIGFERRYNAALQEFDRKRFTETIFEGLPPKPARFEALTTMNRAG
jgi:hydroxyacylglutathione hydrolase